MTRHRRYPSSSGTESYLDICGVEFNRSGRVRDSKPIRFEFDVNL